MKTSIHVDADKQIYGGGVITTRDDPNSRLESPGGAVVLIKRGSVPER